MVFKKRFLCTSRTNQQQLACPLHVGKDMPEVGAWSVQIAFSSCVTVYGSRDFKPAMGTSQLHEDSSQHLSCVALSLSSEIWTENIHQYSEGVGWGGEDWLSTVLTPLSLPLCSGHEDFAIPASLIIYGHQRGEKLIDVLSFPVHKLNLHSS